MSLLGFAMQDKFFAMMAENANVLNDLALSCGLIGFVIFCFQIGRAPLSHMLCWGLLFLIVIVRPIAEPAFFVDLTPDNAPVLDQVPVTGGVLTQDEFDESKLTEDLADAIKEGTVPSSFNDMTGNQQAMITLRNALEAQTRKCEGAPDSEACKKARKNAFELASLAQASRVNNAIPTILGQAYVKSAQDPVALKQSSRDFMGLGKWLSSAGLFFKSSWAGFEAGTYSQIMPIIVAFGTALVLMITPFIYMLGLLAPTFAVSALLLPLIGVAYLQTVKITFTVISLFAHVFLGAQQMNLLQGDGGTFANLFLGTAYTSAFLISGALLYAMRNPAAIVEKLSGSADKASQFSLQEVVGAAYLAKSGFGMISRGLGRAGGAVANAPETLGNAAGRLESWQGGFNTQEDRFANAKHSTIEAGRAATFEADSRRKAPPEDREMVGLRADAHVKDDNEKRMQEMAAGAGVPAAARREATVSEYAEGPTGRYRVERKHDAGLETVTKLIVESSGVDHNKAALAASKLLASQAAVVTMDAGAPKLEIDTDAARSRLGDLGNKLVQHLSDNALIERTSTPSKPYVRVKGSDE
ncbi:hypothetical protein [Amorphus sp. MBR-141]